MKGVTFYTNVKKGERTMKIKFLATGIGPDSYDIHDETINDIDLSIVEYGGKFIGNEQTSKAGIRKAERDEHGELWVTLCQKVGAGHWTGSDTWIDTIDYDPNRIYVLKKNKSHKGRVAGPWMVKE